MPQAPSYDTVGWFARDIDTFALVGSVLLRNEITEARPSRVVIAEDAFELTDERVVDSLQPAIESVVSLVGVSSTERLGSAPLTDWIQQQYILQSREAWESARDWVNQVNPRVRFSTGSSYGVASTRTEKEIDAAKSARKTIIARMKDILTDGTVICLPTTPGVAPLLDGPRGDFMRRLLALVTPASTIGAPQINLPLAQMDGLPVGLSLIGPKGSDEMLIAFARQVAAELGS